MTTAEKITEIIKGIKNELDILFILDSELKLSEDLQFSSYDFVKLVVQIEDAYNIEFEDEYLDFDKFNNFSMLVRYVDSILESR